MSKRVKFYKTPRGMLIGALERAILWLEDYGDDSEFDAKEDAKYYEKLREDIEKEMKRRDVTEVECDACGGDPRDCTNCD